MPKRPTVYHRPQKMTDALLLLAQPDTLPLAGGTKLLAGDVYNAVVDLQELGLDQVSWTDGRLSLGATLKLVDFYGALAAENAADTATPLLQKAIRQAGPNTYRHAATLGGTVASRLPDSELLAALLALDATLTLAGSEIESISLVDYLTAPERPSGLITAITIPWHAGAWASDRVARTPADYPIVSVTAWRPADGAPRLAATGLGERPFRLTAAEAALAPGLTPDAITAAAKAAQNASQHDGDFRGDAAYRAEMGSALTRRVCQAIA